MAEGTKIHVCVVDGLHADLAKTGGEDWGPSVYLFAVATARAFDGQCSMVSQADSYWVFRVLLLVQAGRAIVGGNKRRRVKKSSCTNALFSDPAAASPSSGSAEQANRESEILHCN